MSASTWRDLRSLRHDPPGFANGRGPRRRTFQAALEQCEQFIKAAGGADYATRPLQLFYGRALLDAIGDAGHRWIFPDVGEPWAGVRRHTAKPDPLLMHTHTRNGFRQGVTR